VPYFKEIRNILMTCAASITIKAMKMEMKLLKHALKHKRLESVLLRPLKFLFRLKIFFGAASFEN
jgi:hypothetical protein